MPPPLQLRVSHLSLLTVVAVSAAGIAYIHLSQVEERTNLKRGLAQDDLRYQTKLSRGAPAAAAATKS